MKMIEIQNDWWVPVEDDDGWIQQQVFDHECEFYELREWWCRPKQMTRQLGLPLDEPVQPQSLDPF